MSERNVKRRSYDAAHRLQSAAERRARIVAVASALFASRGFARTTVVSVAAEAGVSPETIYKAFGGKAGLVRAIWQNSLAGTGPDPAEQRADILSATAQRGQDIIAGWVRLSLEVAPRAASVLALVRAASEIDPEAARLLQEIDHARRERMLHNAQVLAARGDLNPALSVAQACELMLIFSSEFYDPLVSHAGWDIDDYVLTMTRVMSAALLRQA